jgi:Fic-DOC domain mobile mystery protein B
MTDLFQEPEDATPLEAEEREQLLQTWITSRADLNIAEQENIIDGTAWARGRRSRRPVDMLNPDFAVMLHKQMFGDVWKWAGTYRTTARNIGIDAYRIGPEVAQLMSDAQYWVENKAYQSDEIAVRFHHRLVAIHPFPNGNGRHSRLMSDLLIERLGGASFTWGGGSLTDTGELRRRYVDALRAADNHDVGPLLKFARS